MLGVVTGLMAEAKTLAHHSAIRVVCTAAQAGRVRPLITQLISGGVTRLMSFGLAGGLAPDLMAGDMVIADTVLGDAQQWRCDTLWGQQLESALPAAHRGAICGGDRIIAASGAKLQLHQQSGALVCDMESQHVAEAAHAAGLPFAAVRVVCDPAHFTLPPAALLPLRGDGSPDLVAILGSLRRQPLQLPALLALAGYNHRAMGALRRMAPKLH